MRSRKVYILSTYQNQLLETDKIVTLHKFSVSINFPIDNTSILVP